jgi:hypothetical protein
VGVYVLLSVRKGDRAARTSALVNSGYEAEEPELHIPLALAKKLSFSLEALRGERYRVVGADTVAYVLGQVEVKLELEDRETPWLTARAVSVPGEHELLISDALAEALGIEIVAPRSGFWRLSGDPTLRRSAPPEYWPD